MFSRLAGGPQTNSAWWENQSHLTEKQAMVRWSSGFTACVYKGYVGTNIHSQLANKKSMNPALTNRQHLLGRHSSLFHIHQESLLYVWCYDLDLHCLHLPCWRTQQGEQQDKCTTLHKADFTVSPMEAQGAKPTLSDAPSAQQRGRFTQCLMVILWWLVPPLKLKGNRGMNLWRW